MAFRLGGLSVIRNDYIGFRAARCVDLAGTAVEEFAAPTTGFVIDQACGSTQS